MVKFLNWRTRHLPPPRKERARLRHSEQSPRPLCALARNLKACYEALTVGPSRNYYIGRAEADITKWIAYFIEGMATSFEKVRDQALREAEKGGKDQSKVL